MNYLAGLMSLIPIMLLGDLVFQQIARRIQISAPFALRLALDWALGTGTVTLIVFYSSLINASSGYLTSIALISILAVFQIIRILKNTYITKNNATIFTRKYGLFILLILIMIGGLWYVAAAAGLGLDGTAHWGIKAKASFLEGGWILIPSGLSRFPHHNYPLLVPTQQGWLYTFVNAVDPEAVKIIFVLFYLALGFLFYHAVRRYYTSILAILYTLLMMTTPLLAITSLAAYADVALMVFVFGSVIFIREWLENDDRSQMILGATLAAFALLVKMEGMVYWLVSFTFIMGYASWFSWRNNSSKLLVQALLFPLSAALIAGSWFVYTWQADLDVKNFASPTIAFLVGNKDRLPVILDQVARQLFLGIGYWGVLWLLFVLVTIWKWRSLARANAFYLWLCVVAPLGVLSFTFLFSLWSRYILHIETALPRIILHTVPIAWLFVASQTNEINVWIQSVRSGE